MGTKIYGIVAAQNPDREGETIMIEGMDISRLNRMKDEHPEQESFFHEIGSINFAKKIFSKDDCENPKQLRAWEFAQVPFVYGEGEIADDTEHPNAKAAGAMVKFASRPDIPLDIGWSADGGILEKKDKNGKVSEDGKFLTQSVALAASLTVKPCNPKAKVWLENDLQKSILDAKVPGNILNLLNKSSSKHSFRETVSKTDLNVLLKLTKLKKSLEDYYGAFTDIRCKKCGVGERFFKSSSDIPNSCSKCGESFSMADVWKSLNK